MSIETQSGLQNVSDGISNGANNGIDNLQHNKQATLLITTILVNKLADSGRTVSPKAIEAIAACIESHQTMFIDSMVSEIKKVGISTGSSEEIRGVDVVRAFEQILKTDNKKSLILHITGNTGAILIGTGVSIVGALLTATLTPFFIVVGISCIVLGLLIFILGIYKGK